MSYQKRLLQAILRQDLKSFVIKSFNALHPGTALQNNWHIDIICEHLQAIANGQIKRLIINIPPRYLKSICASIAWPTWLMGKDPTKKIITCSYSQIISEKNAMAQRNLCYEPWFEELFPNFALCLDQNTKNRFATTKHGFRFSTSVGGALIGEGGDIIIIDDPQNPLLIHCAYYRQNTINWLQQVLLTRLNDKKNGVIVLVMHRLQPEDLTGFLLQKKGEKWHHLSLPIWNKRKLIRIGAHVFKKNQVLHSQRDNKKEINKIKQDVGLYVFEAQFQQNPLMQKSNFIDIEQIPTFDSAPQENMEIWQSWDTANADGKNNDFSVCSTWAIHERNFYLLHILRKKMQYITLKQTIVNHFQHWQAHKIILENKASGQQIIQELSTILPIEKFEPGKSSKLARFMKIIHFFENKRVLLPKKAIWLEDLQHELIHFPNGKHDDQIDSISQFLNFQMNKQLQNLRIRMF